MGLLTAELQLLAAHGTAIHSFTPGEEQIPATPIKGTTPTAKDLGTAGVSAVLSEIPGQPSRPLCALGRGCGPPTAFPPE